jgi:hypothetical protein
LLEAEDQHNQRSISGAIKRDLPRFVGRTEYLFRWHPLAP